MTKRRCPICGEPAAAPTQQPFPFCSRRCKLVDLGNWLGENYRLPAEERVSEAGGEGEWQERGAG